MADPLSLALSAADKLLLQFKNVKTNHAECELLEQLVANTLKLLHQLEPRVFDAPTTTALELVKDALEEVQQAVNKCCNSAFFTSLLHNESYALTLKQAAEKLAHALSQMPLASLGMTADVQSDVVALSKQIRNAKFEERAAMAHQTIALKDAFEKAFNQGGQGTEDIKNLIQEVLHHQCSSTEEMRKELAMLKEHAHEAKKNKEKQQEFELNQIIAVVSASLGDINDVPRVMNDLEELLRCPISKQIMKDPVVLKDSGMTYDRLSIEEWIRRGHRYDPLTNTELVSSELVPNRIVQNACQTLLGQSGGSSYVSKDSSKEIAEPRLVLGLYEGHGKLTIGSSIIHVLQLLLVEPNGKVHGYTLYKREDLIVEENILEIGEGEWNDATNELSFGDNQYSYNGIINFGADYMQSELNWNGTVSEAASKDKEHHFALTYSPPPIQRSTALHPTILQMEGALEATGSKEKYNSKIVLSLEVDSTIGGWIWFESLDHGSRFVGRVINGRWDYDGTLSFPVYFLDQDIPLNSDIAPTNHSAVFKILGNVCQDERASHSKFTAIATRARNEGVRRSNVRTNVPLDDMPILEYSCIRESSTPWYHIHPNPLKIFNMSRTYELGCMDYSVRANFDLSYGSFSHYLRTWGRTPLHIASWNNSTSIVKKLIASGVDVDGQDNIGQSPLHHATKNNSVDVVKNGANVDALDVHGKSPLYIAFDKNFTDISKELLDNGANVDLQDDRRWSQLHHATYNGNTDVVKVKSYSPDDSSLAIQGLISNGAKIDLQDKLGKSPLHVALNKNSTLVIKELLDNGANINLQDNDGSTPLHYATFNDSIDVIKSLLTKGANMNIQDKQGRSPLQIALDKNMTDVIELFDNKATIDLQDNIGWSKLHHAANHNDIDIVKKLISKCANIDLQDNYGQTPLYIASENGHIDVVKELIVNGADVNLQRKDGWTPLHIASQNGHVDVVKELIVSGAKTNLRRTDGWSPLSIASRNGHTEVVKELLVNGANVDLPMKEGWTPLHIASSHGNISIVKILLENGASKRRRNNQGKIPCDVVCINLPSYVLEEDTIRELQALLNP